MWYNIPNNSAVVYPGKTEKAVQKRDSYLSKMFTYSQQKRQGIDIKPILQGKSMVWECLGYLLNKKADLPAKI